MAIFIGSHYLLFKEDRSVPRADSPVIGEVNIPGENLSPETATPLRDSQPATSSSGRSLPPPTNNSTSVPKWASLEERMRWDSEGLEATTHADGHISIDLKGRYTHMSAGIRDASGRLVVQCFTSFSDMSDALTGVPTPPPPTVDPIEYEVSDY